MLSRIKKKMMFMYKKVTKFFIHNTYDLNRVELVDTVNAIPKNLTITGEEDREATNLLANVEWSDENAYISSVDGEVELNTSSGFIGSYTINTIDLKPNTKYTIFLYSADCDTIRSTINAYDTDDNWLTNITNVDISWHNNVGIIDTTGWAYYSIRISLGYKLNTDFDDVYPFLIEGEYTLEEMQDMVEGKWFAYPHIAHRSTNLIHLNKNIAITTTNPGINYSFTTYTTSDEINVVPNQVLYFHIPKPTSSGTFWSMFRYNPKTKTWAFTNYSVVDLKYTVPANIYKIKICIQYTKYTNLGGFEYLRSNCFCNRISSSNINGSYEPYGYKYPIKVQKSIPSQYTEIQYIRNNGTQYIDTGIYASPKTRIEMKFKINELKQQCMFFRTGLSFVYSFYINSNYKFAYGYKDDTGNWIPINTLTPTINTDYILKFDGKNRKIYLNDTSVGMANTKPQNTSTSTITLFGANYNSTVSNVNNSLFSLYYCKIYENDELVRDFIPVKKEDGKTGLYDILNSKFYPNSGTGEFTVGSKTNTHDISSYSKIFNIYSPYKLSNRLSKNLFYPVQGTFTYAGITVTIQGNIITLNGTASTTKYPWIKITNSFDSNSGTPTTSSKSEWFQESMNLNNNTNYIIKEYYMGGYKTINGIKYTDNTGQPSVWIGLNNTAIQTTGNKNICDIVDYSFKGEAHFIGIYLGDGSSQPGLTFHDYKIAIMLYEGNSSQNLSFEPYNELVYDSITIDSEKNAKIKRLSANTVEDISYNQDWSQNMNIPKAESVELSLVKNIPEDILVLNSYSEFEQFPKYTGYYFLYYIGETFEDEDFVTYGWETAEQEIEGYGDGCMNIHTTQLSNIISLEKGSVYLINITEIPTTNNNGVGYGIINSKLNDTDIDWNYLHRKIEVDYYSSNEYLDIIPLEYIEGTGTQYIDSGIKLTQNSKIETTILFDENYKIKRAIFGSRTSATSNNMGAFIGDSTLYFDFHNYSKNRFIYTFTVNEKITITFSKDNVICNDTKFEISTYNNFTTPDSCYIFDMSGNKVNSTEPQAVMRLYKFRIYDNEIIRRDFIPAMRKSDYAIGLYDTVNNVFYENAGTGEFVAGPEL